MSDAIADALDIAVAEWDVARPADVSVATEAELREYLKEAFGASLPSVRCCRHHTPPWTVFCEAYFARHPVIVVKGSRGLAGKTWFLGLLSLAEAVLLHADVAILGGSGGQSKRVQKAIDRFWNAPGAPRHLVKGDPGVVKTTFMAGNEIEALMASQRSVRSPHPQRLRLDECLAGWTRVSTPAGRRRLDSLANGDVILSGTGGNVTVSRVIARGVRGVLRVRLASGVVIEATPEHRFLTDRGWWCATEGLSGCAVAELTVDGLRYARVIAIESAGVVDVWDITVPGGTFIAEGVVTHNCDEMQLKIFEASLGQTMAARGVTAQTLIASTHQNPDGTFTEILKMAVDKRWPVFEWCWRETLQPHGWLDPAEVERKRSEMTADMWRTEIELQEPSSEGRAIDGEAVERMFDRALGETDGAVGRDEVFEEPVKGGSYASGADWGKSAHFSAIATLRTDVRPGRFVALYRDRKRPYHLMVPVLNVRVKRYPGMAAHDAHGVGAVIDELLEVTDIIGYTQWQGAARIALFSEYIAAIERGDLRMPLSEPWYRAHRYVTNADLYGNGHPPDEFIACALAYRASRGVGATEKPLYAGVWGGARRR